MAAAISSSLTLAHPLGVPLTKLRPPMVQQPKAIAGGGAASINRTRWVYTSARRSSLSARWEKSRMIVPPRIVLARLRRSRLLAAAVCCASPGWAGADVHIFDHTGSADPIVEGWTINSFTTDDPM